MISYFLNNWLLSRWVYSSWGNPCLVKPDWCFYRTICYKLLLSGNSYRHWWLSCCLTEVTVHLARPWLRAFLFCVRVTSIWSQTLARAGAWVSVTRNWYWVPLGTDIGYIYGRQNKTGIQRNSQLPLCITTPSFHLREQRKYLAKLYAVKHAFWVFLVHCLDKDTSFLSPFGDMTCLGIYLSAILTMYLL